jgi:hypothetical protein
MDTRKTTLNLPLPLRFLAAWIGVWLGRVLQTQVDYLKAENLLLREKLCTKRVRLTDAERRRLPAHSPNLNAFAERFVLSIKSECLERLVPLGESHLRLAIAEYLRHYHLERNHQGLANALVDGKTPSVAGNGAVACRERLGGLLKFYHREAA